MLTIFYFWKPLFHTSMKSILAFIGWLGLWSSVALAQTIRPLKLQAHKIKQADSLYHIGVVTHDSIKLAEAYYVYGRVYYLVNDFLTSVQYFHKAIRIREKRGDSYELGMLYVRLADNALAQNQRPETKKHFHHALSIFNRIGSMRGKLRVYSGLHVAHESVILSVINDSSYYYLKKAESLAYQLKDSLEIAAINIRLGERLMRLNNRQCINYFQKAVAIHQLHHVDIDHVNALIFLYRAYINFHEYPLAFKTLTQAKQFYKERNLNEVGVEANFEGDFAIYYKAVGNYKMALEKTEKWHQFIENRYQADRDGAVTRLNIEFETEKKEAQIKSQQQELVLRKENETIQQQFLIASAALLLLTMGASVVFFRLSRKNKRISQRNAELVKEQNHRVKNNLQVLSSLLSLQSNRLTDQAAKTAVEESQLRVETMAILQRRLYDGDQLTEVPLADFVEELVEMVLQTFGMDYVETTYTIPTIQLSADHAVRLGLIITELTTNACKYAFVNNPQPIFNINVTKTGRVVSMQVNDNGPGIPIYISQQKLQSFGMKLIEMQSAQLYGTHRFECNNGTWFYLTLKI